MDTVPLLTPTMESDLLKEPWVFPQQKTNVTKEEDKIASPAWEENFQDLSGWCMDTFQGQCDFPTGESPTFKLSGTKYEGNSVLSSGEGVLKDLVSVSNDVKRSLKMNTAETEHLSNNCHSLQSTSNVTSQYEKENSQTKSNTSSNLWSKLSKGSAATLNKSTWSKENDTDVSSTPFQPRFQVDIDLNSACPTSFDSTENQRETWDVLRTVETTGSDSFDLLSYLCDDEMRSPEDSISTDSSIVSKPPWSPTKSTIPQTNVKVKTEEETTTQECTKDRSVASTITSSSTETSVVSIRRTERTRTTPVTSKVEKPYNRARREKAGRKRYIESDTEDQPYTSPLHYRESREKNNEASRKSRMNKKAKETEMAMKAVDLERDNRILKMKVEELEKLVTSMRSALLKSALKKEF